MSPALILLLSAFTAFLAVNWAYFKILRIAKEKHLYDNPGARKLQHEPVPVTGGLAVYFGVICGVLISAALVNLTPQLQFANSLLPILMAMSSMLYVGAMDDIIGLTPRNRVIIEVLALLALIYSTGCCVDTFHGLWQVGTFSWWIGVPLTLFAGVGIINAINMIDGVNGLCSGLCITSSALFGIYFLHIGDISNAALAFVMVGAIIPFYIHNVFGNSSRMFIGDAGSMVMGILMVWFLITILHQPSVITHQPSSPLGLVAMTLAILSVPVADALRVMTMRVVHGRNPLSADRTHLHHVFIAAGVSHFFTSTSIIGINLLIVGLWYLGAQMGMTPDAQFYLVVALCILLVWGTYVIIKYNETHNTRFMRFIRSRILGKHVSHTHWWQSITNFVDTPEGKLD